MTKILFLFLILSVSLLANNKITVTQVPEIETISAVELEKIEQEKELKRNRQIKSYIKQLEEIEQSISKEKVWMKSYASYMTSLDIREKLDKIKKRIKYLKKKGKTLSDLDELNALISKEKILASQIEKLKEKGDSTIF